MHGSFVAHRLESTLIHAYQTHGFSLSPIVQGTEVLKVNPRGNERDIDAMSVHVLCPSALSFENKDS